MHSHRSGGPGPHGRGPGAAQTPAFALLLKTPPRCNTTPPYKRMASQVRHVPPRLRIFAGAGGLDRESRRMPQRAAGAGVSREVRRLWPCAGAVVPQGPSIRATGTGGGTELPQAPSRAGGAALGKRRESSRCRTRAKSVTRQSGPRHPNTRANSKQARLPHHEQPHPAPRKNKLTVRISGAAAAPVLRWGESARHRGR